MKASGQLYERVNLPTERERAPGAHLTGGSVGPRAGQDTVAKKKNPCPCREPKLGRPAHISATTLTGLTASFIISFPILHVILQPKLSLNFDHETPISLLMKQQRTQIHRM